MITLYGFGRVHPGMIGEARDLRAWIACEVFTVADILLASVLRQVRKTDLIKPYPRLKDYYARALARPAWQRTRSLCAERQGVTIADIP
jgi:glutathione S-transferase